MPNTSILNALRDIISDLESKGPPIRCSSLFYLINSLYLCHDIMVRFISYLDTKNYEEASTISAKAGALRLFLRKALENNDLPQKYIFIIKTLYFSADPIQDLMLGLEEYTPSLEEIKIPNDFLIKHLDGICDELVKLNYPITHENNERCLKVESWWNDKVKSKSS